ncbi:hypothetical protein HYE24_00945 [Mycoplasmopsis bovis]|nr:hypothetical protein HYE24_00945 [Mycoplasmopsis bovis]
MIKWTKNLFVNTFYCDTCLVYIYDYATDLLEDAIPPTPCKMSTLKNIADEIIKKRNIQLKDED